MNEDIVVGDRVELEHTTDEYTKLAKGTKGTVRRISNVGFTQIAVDWDDGSRLMMCPEDGDVIRKVEG